MESESDRAECEKTLPTLSPKETPDHPIALWRGNPNQAITTKHESCTKILEDWWRGAKHMLPALLKTDTEGGRDGNQRGQEGRREVFMSVLVYNASGLS